MAQQQITRLYDDLNPDTEAAETVKFGLDGAQYEVDLNEQNATRLREALAPFVSAARVTQRAPRKRNRNRSTKETAEMIEARATTGSEG